MRRFVTVLAFVAVVLLVIVGLWRFRTRPPALKMLDIIVTFVGVTNNAQGKSLVTFRIFNPYPRKIWYLPPRWGSTNALYQGPWQQPFKFLGPRQSDIVQISPPLQDPGTNRWRVTFRAGLKQDVIQRFADPVVDKVRGTSRKYGDYISSVQMQGLRPTPDGALFSGIVEGDHAAVSKAIADGATLDYRRGWTLLHLNAMYSGSTNVARVLFQNGVRIFALDRDGETAADIARRNGHSELARFLEASQHGPAGLLPPSD